MISTSFGYGERESIADAYSKMYAPRRMNESCCCGKNKKVRTVNGVKKTSINTLPTKHRVPSKTGSKLGVRKVMPFKKRDVKSCNDCKIPSKTVSKVKSVKTKNLVGETKDVTHKETNNNCSKLGVRKVMPFKKLDVNHSNKKYAPGVKRIGESISKYQTLDYKYEKPSFTNWKYGIYETPMDEIDNYEYAWNQEQDYQAQRKIKEDDINFFNTTTKEEYEEMKKTLDRLRDEIIRDTVKPEVDYDRIGQYEALKDKIDRYESGRQIIKAREDGEKEISALGESTKFYCITDGERTLCTNAIGESYFNKNGIIGDTRIYESRISAMKDIKKVNALRKAKDKYKVRGCTKIGESIEFVNGGHKVNEGFLDGLGNVISGVGNTVSGVVSGVAKGASGLVDTAAKGVTGLVDTATKGATNVVSGVTNALGSAANGIKNTFSKSTTTQNSTNNVTATPPASTAASQTASQTASTAAQTPGGENSNTNTNPTNGSGDSTPPQTPTVGPTGTGINLQSTGKPTEQTQGSVKMGEEDDNKEQGVKADDTKAENQQGGATDENKAQQIAALKEQREKIDQQLKALGA